MYTSADHWTMMADSVRGAAYTEALRQRVTPGSVVLDIGTGTGAFALQAAKLGAARVYAIEHDDSIQVARALAAANGLTGQIQFIQALSTDVELPERADVIVSDLRGVLPLHGAHLPAIADAADRFLATGGHLIPQRDEVWAALVEAPALYRRLVTPWSDEGGLNYEPARSVAVSRWSKVNLRAEQLLVEPIRWARLDYGRISGANLAGELTWEITHAGEVSALCMWLEATLADDIGFSSAPGDIELIYGQGFFPLATPQRVQPGDQVTVSIAANLVDGDYLWRWSTRVDPAGGAAPRVLEQSNFAAGALSLDTLRKTNLHFVPMLTDAGMVELAILRMVDGSASVAGIAEQVARQFPGRFSDVTTAVREVQAIVKRFGH